MNFNLSKKLTGGALAGASFSVMMAIFIVITFFISIVVSLFALEGLAYTCIGSLSPIISLGLTTFLYGRYNKVNVFRVALGKRINPIYIVLSIVLAGAMFLGLGFANDLIGKGILSLGLKIPQQKTVTSLGEYLAYTLCLAILPSVMEEYFFRGVLINALDFDKEYSIKKAIVCSIIVALSFALYHGSIVQLVYQFVFGFFMCTLTIKSKSIVPSILAHFINNFTILSFMYFGVNIDLYNPWFITIGLVALVLVALVIFLYKRKEVSSESQEILTGVQKANVQVAKERQGIKETETGLVKSVFLYGAIGFVICIALVVGGLFV